MTTIQFYIGLFWFCIRRHKSKLRGRQSLLQMNPHLLEIIKENSVRNQFRIFKNQIETSKYRLT